MSRDSRIDRAYLSICRHFSSRYLCRNFEFLQWLEACLLLDIANCKSDIFAQFYYLSFVTGLLIDSKGHLRVALYWCSLDPPVADMILTSISFHKKLGLRLAHFF